MRARRRARAAKLPPPGLASSAVALGVVGCVLFALLALIGVRETRRDLARRTELSALVASSAKAEALDTAT